VSVKVWYHVRDIDVACSFYVDQLGFELAYLDPDARWARLTAGAMEVGLAEGDPQPDGGVATVDVVDLKSEADRLRSAGVEIGTVLELHGAMRLVDVFDPDGNRVQLAQELS
jgi:catechol 2,3-dioxygenase-like lactoylglutathione lyase family enzyme